MQENNNSDSNKSYPNKSSPVSSGFSFGALRVGGELEREEMGWGMIGRDEGCGRAKHENLHSGGDGRFEWEFSNRVI